MLSTGNRLCPPASTLPSEPVSASTATASSTVCGAWCTNGAGFTCSILPVRGVRGKAPPRPRGRGPRAGRWSAGAGGRSGLPVAPGVARPRGARVALLVEVVATVAVGVGVVAHGRERAAGRVGAHSVGAVAQLLRGDRAGQVVAGDGDDGAERDALEREVLGDV